MVPGSGERDRVELRRLRADDRTVRYEFDHSKGLRRFFSGDDFVVEYDVPIEDIPEGVLVIPWLANVSPIAWATGADVTVPTLDRGFGEALPRAAAAFKRMYPGLVEESTVHVREEDDTETEPAGFDGSALLFSGGVDSVATYYRHREEDPALISIHGHDVSLDDGEGWADRRALIERFATDRGLRTHYIRSNMVAFQEPFMLYAHFGSDLRSDWIDSVHLGLGLSGLCAPLAYKERIGDLYVADSIHRLHVEASADEVANHPTVISELGWSGTDVHNDGYPLTRQEKIDLIAEEAGDDPIELHVCLESATENCGRCEKCLRTVSPLLLAGLDPNRYGFDVDGETFEQARRQFETGEWNTDAGRVSSWRDIQQAVRERRSDVEFGYPEADAFFAWLADVDLDQFEEPNVQIRRRLLRTAARHTPYPLYSRARETDSVVSVATRLLNR